MSVPVQLLRTSWLGYVQGVCAGGFDVRYAQPAIVGHGSVADTARAGWASGNVDEFVMIVPAAPIDAAVIVSLLNVSGPLAMKPQLGALIVVEFSVAVGAVAFSTYTHSWFPPPAESATARVAIQANVVPNTPSRKVGCFTRAMTSTAAALPLYAPEVGGLFTVTITFDPLSVKPFDAASLRAAAVTSAAAG